MEINFLQQLIIKRITTAIQKHVERDKNDGIYYFAFGDKIMKIKAEHFNDEEVPLEKNRLINNALIYIDMIYYDGNYHC